MRTIRSKRLISFALALLISAGCMVTASIPVKAADNLTSIGLAEFGLKAYREGWQYNYGSYGEFNSGGVRQSDCSGLIYAYLAWKGNDVNPPKYGTGMPRTVTEQARASSVSGPMSTLPRTHGLLLTISNYDHVGIYLGNNMSADNSDYGVNMRYQSVSAYKGWIQWHKLDNVEYPTGGWYDFDGDPFYYQNGEYVINTTKTIDGISYTFDSTGMPSPLPSGFEDGDDAVDEDLVSINAKTTVDVNFRTGPSKDYPIIRLLNTGTAVTIINNSNSAWYKVKLADKTTGWVSAQYLSPTDDAVAPPDNTVSIAAKTTDDVNLRKGAGMNYSVIDTIGNGTAITITDKSNSEWFKVKLANGTTGYMNYKYVKENSTTVTPPDVTPPVVTPPDTGDEPTNISAKTKYYVNLRAGAGTNNAVLRVVPSGTGLTIIDKSISGWSKVKLSDGTVGYMSADLLDVDSDSGDQVPPTSDTAKVAAIGGLNLRESGSRTADVLTVMPNGTVVTVLSRSNNAWYQVKTPSGTTGYASSEFLK